MHSPEMLKTHRKAVYINEDLKSIHLIKLVTEKEVKGVEEYMTRMYI